MLTLLFSVLVFWTSTASSQCLNFSSAVPFDRHPYALLSSDYIHSILDYLPSSEDCFLVNSSGLPVYIVFNCSSDANLTKLSTDIAKEFNLWGYNVSFLSAWQKLPQLDLVAVSMNFTGDSDPEPDTPQTPVKRLLLLSANGDLGPSVDPREKVTIEAYGSLNVWNRLTFHGARITVFVLREDPLNPADLRNRITNWFCYREWNVSVYFLNFGNSNRTEDWQWPQVIVQEEHPEFVDECKSNDNKCEGSCVNGLYPRGGYTCNGTDGKLFYVDSYLKNAFNMFSTYLSILSPGSYANSFHKVVVDGDSLTTGQNETAEIVLNDPIPTRGSDIISGILPAIQAILPFHPSRVTVSYQAGTVSGSYSIFFSLLYPAQVVVSFTSTEGSGVGSDALSVIELLADLPATNSKVTINATKVGSTVTVTFAEDLASFGTHNYKTAACTFFKALANATLVETLEDYFRNITSVTTTDTSCSGDNPLPPPPPSSLTTPVIAGIVAAAVVVVIIAVVLMCYFAKPEEKGRPYRHF